MQTVGVDRSNPDVIDLVLQEGGGSLRHAARSSLGMVRALPLWAAIGVLCTLPVYIVMLFAGAGWGPVWAVAGVVGAVGAVFGALAGACLAFLDVHRLRFSPATMPATVALVRGARTGRPRPLAKVRRIRIDHSVEEPYDGDPLPESVTITLTVQLQHGRTRSTSLSPETDTVALHRELHQALTPVVQVDLFVRHHRRPKPLPPDPHRKIAWDALGRGTGAGGC
ncbi:hypothetical protein ABZZ44_31765 [Streptomyces sp. NPDC006460]|uniref:hypothetical protein n=2 Tax=unclassified Streptomyces TaxID=2593676 RepID=UPI0033AEDED5